MSRKRKHISHLSFKIFLRIGQLAKKNKKTKQKTTKRRKDTYQKLLLHISPG